MFKKFSGFFVGDAKCGIRVARFGIRDKEIVKNFF